jgi:hypothetical protein
MATNANHHSPGVVVRVLHRLFPSWHHVLFEAIAGMVSLLLGLPIVLHVVVLLVLHLLARFRRQRIQKGGRRRHSPSVP